MGARRSTPAPDAVDGHTADGRMVVVRGIDRGSSSAGDGSDAEVSPDLDVDVLEERLAALEAARAWSPGVVAQLGSLIQSGEDLDLFRVNPLAYEAEASVEEHEAVDLFLHAAHVGLFRMEWDIVCASCGNTARSFRSLEKVDPHFVCDLCQMENDATLDEAIQVTFTISPDVRPIAYHEPATLSAEDLYFRWQFSRDVRAMSDGMTMPQWLQAATRFVGHIEPAGIETVEFEFSGIALAVRDVLHSASAFYVAEDQTGAGPEGGESLGPPGGPVHHSITLTLSRGRLLDGDRILEARDLEFAPYPGARFRYPSAATIERGPLRIGIENAMPERASVWVVEYPDIPETMGFIEFKPILSAKRVLSIQTFRTLFRSETVAASEGLAVRDLTFLFTDLRDSTAMYERIGDATAYDLVRRHFDALGIAIAANGGAIVKTMGDAVMATFAEPASGVRAAFAMAERLGDLVRASPAALELKVGLHRGHALAVTANESVDYFGQTVNIAARIQALAAAGQLCLSQDVFDAAGVHELLAARAVQRDTGILKGVTEEIPIYRVPLAP